MSEAVPITTPRRSIAAATLRSAAIRIAIIILVATTIAYLHFFSSIKDRHLNELVEFGRERGERELAMFQLAQDDLQIIQQAMDAQWERLAQADVDAQFEQIAPRYPDGTRRSPKLNFDLENEAQIWIARNVQLSPSGRRQLVLSHDLLSRFGPVWRNRFPDMYYIGAEDFVVNFWSKEPFAFNVASDFTFLKESYYTIGLPENNPTKINTLALSELGIALMLDDFGTGYSALAYLKRLPLAGIKLDRSFVYDLVENRHSQAIVFSLIAMSRQLGMLLIAEGVESEAQLRFLQNAGCDQVREFLLSRPETPDDVMQRMRPSVSRALAV